MESVRMTNTNYYSTFLNMEALQMDTDDWTMRRELMKATLLLHVGFMAAFYLLMNALLLVFRRNQDEVPTRNKLLATFQAPRGIHAIFVVMAAIYALVTSSYMSRDIVTGRTPIGTAITAITLAYHVSDTVLIVVGHFFLGLKNGLFAFHHFVMIAFYSAILATDSCYYIGCVFLLAESPVPFVTVKLISQGLRVNLADTVFGKINDYLIVHFFHMRNAFDIYLWFRIYANRQAMLDRVPSYMVFILMVFMLLMSAFFVPHFTLFFTQMCLPQHIARGFEDKKGYGNNKKKN